MTGLCVQHLLQNGFIRHDILRSPYFGHAFFSEISEGRSHSIEEDLKGRLTPFLRDSVSHFDKRVTALFRQNFLGWCKKLAFS